MSVITNSKKNASYRVSGVFFAGKLRRGGAGFTLIELLVVLVIIAMFSSMVVISVGDNFQREMQAEAERLQSIIVSAADEAVYTSNEFGLYLTEKGYIPLQFNRFDNRWLMLSKKPFLPHELPQGMRLDWTVEGFTMPGSEENTNSRKIDFKALLENNGDSNEEQAGDWFAKTDELEQSSTQTERFEPQILTLSSGEITVFSITFMAEEGLANRVSYTLESDGFSMPVIKHASSFDEDT